MALNKPRRNPWHFIQEHPGLIGLIALILGLIAQYLVQNKYEVLGGIGYALAVVLFLIAFRGSAPETFEAATPSATATEPRTFRWPSVKTLIPSAPKSTPVAVTPVLSVQAPPKPLPVTVKAEPSGSGFFSRWRYYTVADILARRQPQLPPEIIAPAPALEVIAPEPEVIPQELARSTPLPTTPPLEVEVAPMAVEVRPKVIEEAAHPTAAIEFVEPVAVLMSLHGNAFVIDRGQGKIIRLDAEGQPNKQWSVSDLPQPLGSNYAVSPDGTTLYIAEPLQHRVRVIRLT